MNFLRPLLDAFLSLLQLHRREAIVPACCLGVLQMFVDQHCGASRDLGEEVSFVMVFLEQS